ncbi:MAG: PKD domain-containing protein, partial [Flavobacteriales bacterium]|nr:PKD domain-containing protein [Flavobacteriales bacterium]
MRALAILFSFVFTLQGFATHILGGEMSYTYLGDDDYFVTLTLYRDCGPDNVNNTALDFQAAIGIFNSSGSLVNTVHFDLPGELNVPVVVINPCLAAPPSICAKMGIYSGTIHLPSGTGGYTLTYQRCCRSPVVTNITNTPAQGMTVTVQVPDPDITGANNSPAFQYDPPTVLCLDQTFVLDQLAVDPDGDSLAYSMCSPLQGGDDLFNAMPDPPLAPPYNPIVWAPGFSTSNQLNSTPPAVFANNDGFLTVHPTTIGSFAVSLCVSEFRNGVLLNTLVRDFRFLVVPCAQAIVSDFMEQQATCDGLQVQFHNESTGTSEYLWDFGVTGSTADTSSATDPNFTFPAPGSYTVTLITGASLACSDTSTHVFTVHDPVSVAFTPPPILCADDLPYPMVAFGNFGPSATVTWNFGDGISPFPDSANTTVDFPEMGSHAVSISVTEDGCTASFADSVRVFPLPTAEFTLDTTAGCIPFTPVFTNTSTAWTPMEYLWYFGDGTSSTDSIPEKTYGAPGIFDVSLTTTTSAGCIASVTQLQPGLVQIWPQPEASAIASPVVTTVLFPDVQFTDNSIDATTWDYFLEGIHYDTPNFMHTFTAAGWQTAYLTVTSGHGCFDTTSVRVFIGDHLFFAPSAFSPNGDDFNETWKPSVLGAREYQLDVFDRWGREVFSTTDPNAGWDGKNAMPGMYSYKAWLTEYGPLEKEYNGSFVL